MPATRCENCKKKLTYRDEQAGRKGRCPKCGKPVDLPVAPDAAAQSASSSHEPDDQKLSEFAESWSKFVAHKELQKLAIANAEPRCAKCNGMINREKDL